VKNRLSKEDKDRLGVKIFIGVAPEASLNKPSMKQHSTPLFEDYTFDNLELGNAN
jgi:chromosomal replication initiator protein